MLYYNVEVHPQRVLVNEVKRLAMYDQKAIVDGVTWLYKIKRSKRFPPKDKDWYGRALNTIFRHAKNSGGHVTFDPIDQAGLRRAMKRHEKQIRLF